MQGREQAVDRPGMMTDSFRPALGKLRIIFWVGEGGQLRGLHGSTFAPSSSPHHPQDPPTMAIDGVFQQPPWAAGLPLPMTFLRFESKHIRTAGRTAFPPTFQ